MNHKTMLYALLSAAVVTTCALVYYFTFWNPSSKIEPPLRSLQIPFDTLTFKAESGLQYHHFTGSNIRIPALAFEDSKGYPVSGNVSVLYREFHSPKDIFLSGIPLGTMGDDDNRALQSDGMFQINAYQGKEKLKLAKNKNISVELASFRATNDYSVFKLDEGNLQWSQEGTPELIPNVSKENECAALPPLPVFPLDPRIHESDIIVETEADYLEYPHLYSFRNYRWKIANVPENSDLENQQWVFRVHWDRFKLEVFDKEKNLFKMTMKAEWRNYENKSSSRSYSVIVMPVLDGNNYEKALAAFQADYAQYSETLVFIEKEEERLAREADVLNAFNIDQMGIWNIDKFMNNEIFVKITGSFDFENQFNPMFYKIKVYVINHSDNNVQSYSKKQWDNIYIRPGSITSVIAVLPNEQVGIFTKEAFSKVDFNQVYRKDRSFLFSMEIVPESEANLELIQRVI